MNDQKIRILIVDDSEDDRSMYAQFLTMKGYRVSKASDGKEGVAKAIEFRPHLILIDLWLPIMSGWEAMRRLREDERTRNSRLLVITGHSPVRPLGCDGWLTKPCALDQLDAQIIAILEANKRLLPDATTPAAIGGDIAMTMPPPPTRTARNSKR